MKIQAKLRIAVEFLDDLAAWDEGEGVSPSFDNPILARDAREALKKIRGGDGRPPGKAGAKRKVELEAGELVILDEALTALRVSLRSEAKACGTALGLEDDLARIYKLRHKLQGLG